jgi:hypothetical protein
MLTHPASPHILLFSCERAAWDEPSLDRTPDLAADGRRSIDVYPNWNGARAGHSRYFLVWPNGTNAAKKHTRTPGLVCGKFPINDCIRLADQAWIRLAVFLKVGRRASPFARSAVI